MLYNVAGFRSKTARFDSREGTWFLLAFNRGSASLMIIFHSPRYPHASGKPPVALPAARPSVSHATSTSVPQYCTETNSKRMKTTRLDDFTLIRERASAPSQRAASIVSRQIRSTGTIGGSVVNGSLLTDNGTFAPVPERPPTDHEYNGAATVAKVLLPLEQREG